MPLVGANAEPSDRERDYGKMDRCSGAAEPMRQALRALATRQ
jgi:hypothetical protein